MTIPDLSEQRTALLYALEDADKVIAVLVAHLLHAQKMRVMDDLEQRGLADHQSQRDAILSEFRS